MTNTIRNLTRLIWLTLPEPSQVDHLNKVVHIKLLLAFAYAVRHELLYEAGQFTDFENLLSIDMKNAHLEDAMPLPYQITFKV